MSQELYQVALEVITRGERAIIQSTSQRKDYFHEVIGTETDKAHLEIRFIGGFCSYEYTMGLESDPNSPEVFRFIDDRREQAALELARLLEM